MVEGFKGDPSIASKTPCGGTISDVHVCKMPDSQRGRQGAIGVKGVDRPWIDEEDLELSENHLEEVNRAMEGGEE